MKQSHIKFFEQMSQSALKMIKWIYAEVVVFKSLKNTTNIDCSVTL